MSLENTGNFLREQLAFLISKEVFFPSGLITVTNVRISPDLKNATAYITVMPENVTGTALDLLRRHNHIFAKSLSKTRLRRIPRIEWGTDEQEQNARKIYEAMDSIERDA